MKIIYRIESDGHDPIEVTPFSGNDLKLTWEKEDDRRYDYKKELKEIKLIKNDFKAFYEIERSLNRCDLQTLYVIMLCGNNTEEHILFTGTFSMSSGNWDLDKCTVSFDIETLSPYTCIEENDDEYNILEFQNTQTVSLGLKFGVETYVCKSSGPYDLPLCDEQIIEDGKWTFVLKRKIFIDYIFLYVRNYMIVDCDYLPSSDWLLLEDCSNNTKKYIKKIEGDPNNIVGIDSDGNLLFFQDEEVSELDNGRNLLEVMQMLLDLACPDSGLTIVSDFFQWNAENVTQINYVTGQLNDLTNLILFQKSDVKRPNNSGNATIAEINFIDLLEQIIEIFNLGYKIIDNTFRIEHISFFESDLGMNLVSLDTKNLLKNTKQYGYDVSKLPKYEKFNFMEAGSVDFVGTDIVYSSECVNNNPENKSKIDIDKITTDVMYCIENPDPEGNVSDEGFVLMACDENNNLLYINGILENNTTINNTISWANLHDKYWKHGRVLPTGNMNGEETEFLSTVPVIKQDQFSCILPCTLIKDFNPLELVKGSLGYGFIQTAELTLSQCVMTFDLLLDTIDLNNNESPLGDFDEDFSEEFD
ncbi:hypothetical protein [Winogradskyella forsetii]|uniref:hypothetical protein n=1 Tax=Winogradskyella forsetii TaxID=2686077 RepID=UPI0015BDD077|nr:hypothetical protein [Winogradskyella forsetii]